MTTSHLECIQKENFLLRGILERELISIKVRDSIGLIAQMVANVSHGVNTRR